MIHGLVPNTSYEYDHKEYRTVFGPSFAHNGIWSRNDRVSLCGAIKRLTCSREPSTPGFHNDLINHQCVNVTYLKQIDYIIRFRNLLANIQVQLSESGQQNWANQVHPKRIMRINTLRSIYGNGRQAAPDWCHSVQYKVKTGEILPPGKYTRAIADLGCPSSCKGGYLMDSVKDVFKLPYLYRNGCAQFYGAPSNEYMVDVFSKLLDPAHYGYSVFFPFFSDDSCISVVCSDGLFKANCDISSCDGSNFKPVFDMLKLCMLTGTESDKDVYSIFSQCEKDLVIRDPLCKVKDKITLKNTGIALFSGSVLTTSINNLANTLIYRQFMSHYRSDLTISEIPELLMLSAREVGYLLKVDIATHYSELQFLKCSPCYDVDGNLRSYVNLGVWLRTYGSCVGDLPGRKKDGLDVRIKRFRSDVTLGCYNWGNHKLNRAFQKFIVSKKRF